MTQALHQAFTAIARLPHVFHGNRADLAIEGDADRPHVLEALVLQKLPCVALLLYLRDGPPCVGNHVEITIKIDRYSKATSIGDPMTPTTL